MKKIYVNPDKAQAVEVFENGKIVVHFEGMMPDPHEPDKYEPESKTFSNNRFQECETAALIKNMVAIRGDKKNV